MTIPSYRAFISYRHSKTGRMHAQMLESAVKNYARPLFQRPMFLFRDEKHMVPHQDLPGTIQRSLDHSEFLIYIAEKAAAESTWCRKELDQWLNNLARGQKLIVVQVADKVAFEPGTRRIDWEKTNALPPIQSELELAHYFDLRWISSKEDFTVQHSRYESVINGISALLQGRDQEAMRIKARQVKRTRRLIINATLMVLFLLTMSLARLSWLALANTKKAQLAERSYRQQEIKADSSKNFLIREQQAALQAIRQAELAKTNADSLTELALWQKGKTDHTLSQFRRSFSNSLATKGYTYLDNNSRLALLLLKEAEEYQSPISFDTLLPYLSLNIPELYNQSYSYQQFKQSLDTKNFAFKANWNGKQMNNSGLNIWNPEKDSLISFEDNCCLDYAFSNDNRKFTFYTNYKSRESTARLNIYDLQNSHLQTIDNCYFHKNSNAFRDDGRMLAYITKEGPRDSALYKLHILDFSNNQTLTFPQLRADRKWAFSPDFSRLAFVQRDSSHEDALRLVVWNFKKQMIEWEDPYLSWENQDEIETFLFLNGGESIAYFTKNESEERLYYKVHAFEHGPKLQLALHKKHHLRFAPNSSNITFVIDEADPAIHFWDFAKNASTKIASLTGLAYEDFRSHSTFSSWDTLNFRFKHETTYYDSVSSTNHYRFDINLQGNFIAFQTNFVLETERSDLYIYDVAAGKIIKHFNDIPIDKSINSQDFKFSAGGTKVVFTEERNHSNWLEKLTVFDLYSQKSHVFDKVIKNSIQFFNEDHKLIYISRKAADDKAAKLHVVNFEEDTVHAFDLSKAPSSKYTFNEKEDKLALHIYREDNTIDLIIWDAQLLDTIQFSNIYSGSYTFSANWEKVILLKDEGREASVRHLGNKQEIRQIRHVNPIQKHGFLYDDQYVYTTSSDAFGNKDLLKISILLPADQLLAFYSKYFSEFSPEEQRKFLLLSSSNN